MLFIGLGSALRGKPVLTVCNPYYVFGDQFKKIDENTPDSEILEHLKSNTGELSKNTKYNLVANLLSGLRKGNYINDASWSSGNPDHIRQSREIGLEIKRELVQN